MENKTKKCSKCGKEYPATLEFFQKRSRIRCGLHSICKQCFHKQNKEYRMKSNDLIKKRYKRYYQKHKEEVNRRIKKYRMKNIERYRARSKAYCIEHKEEGKQYHKEYRVKNRRRIADRSKQYIQENKQKIKDRLRIYRDNNREKIKECSRKYVLKNREKINKRCRERMKRDVGCRILSNLRRRLCRVFEIAGVKKDKHTMDLVGCTVEYLKRYLEDRFLHGMTWDNYGFYGWHIDHITPCVFFDLTKPKEQRKCFHYTNLQPLWQKDNLEKNSWYNGKLIRKSNKNKEGEEKCHLV